MDGSVSYPVSTTIELVSQQNNNMVIMLISRGFMKVPIFTYVESRMYQKDRVT
jgi:hypothetical protein